MTFRFQSRLHNMINKQNAKPNCRRGRYYTITLGARRTERHSLARNGFNFLFLFRNDTAERREAVERWRQVSFGVNSLPKTSTDKLLPNTMYHRPMYVYACVMLTTSSYFKLVYLRIVMFS